jgi:trimeric autotransporter adhesin
MTFLVALGLFGLSACGTTNPQALGGGTGAPDATMLMSLEEAPDETYSYDGQGIGLAAASAKVRVIHASPDAPAVDIYVDDAKAISDLAYTKTAGPADLPTGKRNLKVKAAGTDTTVIDVSPELEARRYSVYAVGKLANIEPLLLEDTRFAAKNAAKVRVLHASPSAPKVDIYLSRPGTDINKIDPIKENVAFKSISDYFRIRPGKLQVRVTLADTKTVAIDSGALEITAGDILTAVAIDKAGTAGGFSAIVVQERERQAEVKKSIVEIAVADKQFSTLVGALKSADLVTALSGAGPFTVFAPTNAAFAKLAAVPGGEALKNVLLYHVASGALSGNEIAAAASVKTLQGANIKAELKGSSLILNGNTKVIIKDIQASNGVIHVIDTVLLPPAPAMARVRAVHASSDAPAVNILVDGAAAFSGANFRDATPFAKVPAGNRNIKVQVASNGATAINADLDLADGTDYTVLAINKVANIGPLVLNDNNDGNSKPANGKTKVRLVHAAADPAAATVDVYITAPHADLRNTNPTIKGFAFKTNSKFLEVAAGHYQVRITLPGTKTVVIDTGSLNLESGKLYTGIAVDPKPGTSAFGAVLLAD